MIQREYVTPNQCDICEDFTETTTLTKNGFDFSVCKSCSIPGKQIINSPNKEKLPSWFIESNKD